MPKKKMMRRKVPRRTPRKKAVRPKAIKKTPARRTKKADITDITDADLLAEMRRRERGRSVVVGRWKRCLQSKAKIEAEMNELGITIPKVPASSNGLTLTDALAKGLGNKSLTIREAAAAAIEAGFVTTNKSFVSTVGQLLAHSTGFKRVSPGVYRVRKS